MAQRAEIEAISTLFGAAQSARNVVSVAQEKFGGVHQGVIFFFGGYREAGQDGFGEGVVDGAFFGGIVADGAIVQIFLHEQNFGPAAFEPDDARGAELAAVEADVVGADAGGQAALVQKFRVPLVDFEPEFALFGVPVQIEVAGQFLGASGFFRDGCGRRIGARECAARQHERSKNEA